MSSSFGKLIAVAFGSSSRQGFSSSCQDNPIGRENLAIFQKDTGHLFIFDQDTLDFYVGPNLDLQPLQFLDESFENCSGFICDREHPTVILFLQGDAAFDEKGHDVILTELGKAAVQEFSVSGNVPDDFFFGTVVGDVAAAPACQE